MREINAETTTEFLQAHKELKGMKDMCMPLEYFIPKDFCRGEREMTLVQYFCEVCDEALVDSPFEVVGFDTIEGYGAVVAIGMNGTPVKFIPVSGHSSDSIWSSAYSAFEKDQDDAISVAEHNSSK